MFKLERFVVGPLMVNSYILYDDTGAVVVDPGADADKIVKFIEFHSLKLVAILLTHGHFDHIGAVAELHKQYNPKVYIHNMDLNLYRKAKEHATMYNISLKTPPISNLYFLDGNEDLMFNNKMVQVFHTPGHTKGGLSFYIPDMKLVFTGDLIFKGTVGRTDFEDSSFVELVNSIRNKIYTLSDDIVIYPGHGAPTTVKEEKLANEFVRLEASV